MTYVRRSAPRGRRRRYRRRTTGMAARSTRMRYAAQRKMVSRWRPRRKVGRVQTRRLMPPRKESDFKVQRERYTPRFWRNVTLGSETAYDARSNLFGYYLSPRQSEDISTADPSRAVLGFKSRLMGINIKGSITNLTNENILWRIMVVQINEPDILDTGAVDNFADSATMMKEFWKNQNFSDPEFSYSNFAVLNAQTRKYAAVNLGRFKVLKTKYFTTRGTPTGELNSMHFHMYVPVDVQLEQDQLQSCSEPRDNSTGPSQTDTCERYAYYRPCIMTIEPLFYNGTTFLQDLTNPMAGADISVKYTICDNA